MRDGGVNRAVPQVVEGVDLDHRPLALGDEADVAVLDRRRDLERARGRHDAHQRLARLDHAADRVHRQLGDPAGPLIIAGAPRALVIPSRTNIAMGIPA
jgi:hypothetical protein